MRIEFPGLAELSLSTIRLTMKRKLQMAWKVASTRYLPSSTAEVALHRREASTILLALLKADATVIFIDEY